MKLHTLKPAEGSTHSRRRIGRGPGSGLGGTSTRVTRVPRLALVIRERLDSKVVRCHSSVEIGRAHV